MNGYVGAVIIAISFMGLMFGYVQENNKTSSAYQYAVSEMSQGNNKILISRTEMGREKYQEIYRMALENNYHITQISDDQAVLEKFTNAQNKK